jgi:hypothetical protein
MSNRREFLARSTQLGALATIGDFAFLGNLPHLTAQEVQRALAPVEADVEPLVRLIEDTPRARLLEEVGTRIRNNSASYQQVLSAVMLAGVRGIQPRPVGFKFHAVLVVNSAHLASLAAEERDRWLPLFWAIDNFKSSQERNAREGDWRMAPIAVDRLPGPETAVRNFRSAMDNWEVEAADRAVAQLARMSTLNEVYEIFWRYGARDFRDIGHKAIYVANSYRTMVTIGWRHAEPIVRSLAYALLEHEGANPAGRTDPVDVPGRDNQRRLARIRADWQRGEVANASVTDMLATLRTASPGDAAEEIVTMLNARVDPSCIWDALFLFGGELLMKQPGIVGLHTLTSMNALAFGYQTTASDETRRFLMLQAAVFLMMFRTRMTGLPQNPRIDAFEPGELAGEGQATIDDIFSRIPANRLTAARKTLALLQTRAGQVNPFMTTARRLIFAKGTDSHDYKFSSAALEDFHHVTPAWRNRFLAASVYWLKGSAGNDTPLVQRTRTALGG